MADGRIDRRAVTVTFILFMHQIKCFDNEFDRILSMKEPLEGGPNIELFRV